MTSELVEVKKEEVSESSILTLDNSTANSTEIKINELMDMKIEKDKIYDADTIYGNDIKDKNPKKLGNTYAFLYLNGEPLIVIGPHWPFYAGLTSFITMMCFLYFHYLWVILNPVIGYIGVFVFSFYSISYTATFLINPGIPSRKYSIANLTPIEIKQKKICSLCKIYLVPGLKIAHCYECRVCVEGHDHHCPWTSKCVGKRNLIPFYGFVISIFLIFFYLIFATCTLGIFINPRSS